MNKWIDEIKKICITINRKEGHKPKLYEVQKLLDRIYDDTNYYFILSSRNEYFLQYKKLVNDMYKETTKKEMDRLLKLTLEKAIKEIMECDELFKAV